jgi:hypothetical protein
VPAARIGNQCQFAVENPDELVLATMPMTLAGPGSRLDDRQIDAELSKSARTRQPLTRLRLAPPVEGARIVSAGQRGYVGKVYISSSFRPLHGQETGCGILVPHTGPAQAARRHRPTWRSPTTRFHRQEAAVRGLG